MTELSVLETMEQAKMELANKELAGHVGECLHRNYPKHLWAVVADIHNGIVTVRNLALSGDWGFYIHIADFVNDPHFKAVTRAGGELLERFKVARGEADYGAILDLKTDFAGRKEHDNG